jgi:hypothetical protein
MVRCGTMRRQSVDICRLSSVDGKIIVSGSAIMKKFSLALAGSLAFASPCLAQTTYPAAPPVVIDGPATTGTITSGQNNTGADANVVVPFGSTVPIPSSPTRPSAATPTSRRGPFRRAAAAVPAAATTDLQHIGRTNAPVSQHAPRGSAAAGRLSSGTMFLTASLTVASGRGTRLDTVHGPLISVTPPQPVRCK